MSRFLILPVCLFGILAGGISSAEASCGSAFCPVNTQWNTQGVWTEPGWRADVRYEYIPQDQLRSGSDTVSVGQISKHHDEVKTINRNILATLDYGSADGWGITASLPVVDRNHLHIHNHHGHELLEQWELTEIGDVQLMGRYQFNRLNLPYVLGVYAGAKLPTGNFDVANSNGDIAERSLQPGTGTTDALIGMYVRKNLPNIHSSLFAQTIAQLPLNERNGYKPGEKLSIDLGYRYDTTKRLSLLLQLNGQFRWKDSGENAESEDSGGQVVSVSPGLSYAINDAVQLYGFIQQPLYQHVNGVQLTADWSVTTGISWRF